MNTNIDKTQLFHKIKYDHRGQSRSHTTCPYLDTVQVMSAGGFQLVSAVGFQWCQVWVFNWCQLWGILYILGHIFIR